MISQLPQILCHIFMFVMRGVLASPRRGKHWSSLRWIFEYIWFLRWQQCANPHSIVSVKLGSFVNISPLMQPSFLFKLLLHQSLTTVIRYCMVYLRTWLNSSNVCRTQLLVLLLFRPKFCHMTTVLANLHWLSIYLQIEFKILIATVTSGKPLHGLAPAYIKDLLQSYLPGSKVLLVVPAFSINSYRRKGFFCCCAAVWNSLPQHIRDAGSLDIFKRQLKTVLFRRDFLNWLRDCVFFFIAGLKLFYL